MSHIDTFDLKTGHENQGSTTPINTNADGIRVSSHLPGLAKQADKLCIVNSLTSTAGDHEKGNYFMHTSYQQRATIRHPDLARGITSSKANLTPRYPLPYSLAVKVAFTEAEGFSSPNSNRWLSRSHNPDSNTQGPWSRKLDLREGLSWRMTSMPNSSSDITPNPFGPMDICMPMRFA